jgi:predicted ATPase
LEAELNRHKGQLLRQGHSDAAEELYHIALTIAQGQGAKLWELRAAANLARLRRDRGRQILTDVCGLGCAWVRLGRDCQSASCPLL